MSGSCISAAFADLDARIVQRHLRYRHELNEVMADERVFYCGFVAVHADHRGSTAFVDVVGACVRRLQRWTV